jgi:predicted nucleic acid-binding protein
VVDSFILDASVTAAWCFADEATEATQTLRRSLVTSTATVPSLWHLESANMLLVAERRRRITATRCSELLEFLAALPLRTEDERQRIRGPVLDLARKHRLTVYDAVYLDLALQQALPLATRDKDIRRAARSAGVELIEV